MARQVGALLEGKRRKKKKQKTTAEAASKPSTGVADKQAAIGDPTVPQSPGSTVKTPSGAANSPPSSPGTAPSKPALTRNSLPPVTEVPTSLPCTQTSTSPSEQTVESPLLPKLNLAASPSCPAIPEAASKPSTGSADKQMASVDNKQSPGTVPSKLVITRSSLPTTAPTEALGKSSAPVPNSSVLRNRHQEKKKTKKRVSPKGTSTHKKTVSPGAAKPRRAKSQQVTPSKAPRRHASPRSPPCRAPFAPVGPPLPQDMVALCNLVLSLAIYLILLNALITALA